MRTTIEISDSLLARARNVLRRRKTTLRALVEEGLERVLEDERQPFVLRDESFKGQAGYAAGAGPEDLPRILRELNEGRPLP